MPGFKTICITFHNVAHLHLILLSEHFKCLMLFANLQFFSIIQRSCMTVTNCWCIVLVYASHQHCLSIAIKNFHVLHSALGFLYFCDSSITSNI